MQLHKFQIRIYWGFLKWVDFEGWNDIRFSTMNLHYTHVQDLLLDILILIIIRVLIILKGKTGCIGD